MAEAAGGRRRPSTGVIIGILGLVAGLIAVLANLTSILSFVGISSPFVPKLFQYGPVTPGPNCDHQPGRWILAHATASCVSSDNALDKLQLATADQDSIGQVFFYADPQVPKNAQIQVDVDGLQPGGCAGITARDADARAGAYAFEVCSSGTWIIAKYAATASSSAEQPFNLMIGSVPPASAYHLTVVVDGVSLRFVINSNPEVATADGAYPGADAIGLFVSPLASAKGTANFQRFEIREVRD